jgi:hypothetical protein
VRTQSVDQIAAAFRGESAQPNRATQRQELFVSFQPAAELVS